MLCYLTIGTENISIQIEEPFAIMPLMEFCQGMESSVIDIMDSCLSELSYASYTLPLHVYSCMYLSAPLKNFGHQQEVNVWID